MIYEWKTGHSRSVSAQIVGERVEELSAGGVCHPAALVDDARPEQSPIHTFFDWEDASAADKFRTHQARQLIGSIRIAVDGSIQQAPAFVHVRLNEQDGYVPTVIAISEVDMREQVIHAALKQYEALNDRYASLVEFAPIRQAFTTVIATESAIAAD